jgi:hypothetical protein
VLGRAIRPNRGQGVPEHLGGTAVASGRRGIVDRAAAPAHLGERPGIPVGECHRVGVDCAGTGGAGDTADARRGPSAPFDATHRPERRVHPPGTDCRRPGAGGSSEADRRKRAGSAAIASRRRTNLCAFVRSDAIADASSNTDGAARTHANADSSPNSNPNLDPEPNPGSGHRAGRDAPGDGIHLRVDVHGERLLRRPRWQWLVSNC